MPHKGQLTMMFCFALHIYVHPCQKRKHSYPKSFWSTNYFRPPFLNWGHTDKHTGKHETSVTKEQFTLLTMPPSHWGALPMACSMSLAAPLLHPSFLFEALPHHTSVCPLFWGQVYTTVIIQIIGAKPNQAKTCFNKYFLNIFSEKLNLLIWISSSLVGFPCCPWN